MNYILFLKNHIFNILNSKKFFFGTLTFLTSFGGFPEPPKFLKTFSESIFVQYFFLFLLVIQGGSEGHVLTSFLTIFLLGTIMESVKYIEKKFNDKNENKTSKRKLINRG